MSDNHEVRHKATMTRGQWRSWFLRAEMESPTHKAAQRWLAALAAETHEVSECTVQAASGHISLPKNYDKKRDAERVALELSRDAVLGMKYTAIRILVGDLEARPKRHPANPLERANLLDSLRDVGPGGTLLRLVEKEAVLPDSPELDEDELDLEPEAEKAALPAPKPAEAKG